jgi:hypothetical protein
LLAHYPLHVSCQRRLVMYVWQWLPRGVLTVYARVPSGHVLMLPIGGH